MDAQDIMKVLSLFDAMEDCETENRKYLGLAEKITSANNRHRKSLLSKIADISQQKD